MRVIVNQQSAAGRKTGVGYYTRRLLDALRARDGEDEIDSFPDGSLWAAYRVWANIDPLISEFRRRSLSLGRYPLLKAVAGLSRVAVRQMKSWGKAAWARQYQARFSNSRYDVYHEPNFIPMPTSLPTVVTLHDLSVLLHPEWHPQNRVALYEQRFHLGLKRSKHIVTVSDTIRQEVIRHLHIPPARVTRVYNGVHADMSPWPREMTARVLHRLGLREGYLLFLGTLEPRKNVLMLMQAYCGLSSELRERCPLLLVGGWGWKSEAIADFYQTEARHMGVRHLGYVAERYLPALYNGARALTYPSYYEGFGLPPLEMMACGGAVLASTADVFIETIGGQAELIPADDMPGWRNAMVKIIREEDWRQALRAGAVELARDYTWDRSAEETVAVYRRMGRQVVPYSAPGRAAA